MSVAFNVAQGIGNKLAQGYRAAQDENAIESILSKAVESGDPAQLQNSIGQILSKVSPERQPMAIKYLESAYKNVTERNTKASQAKALRESGVNPNLPANIQLAQYKSNEEYNQLPEFMKNKGQERRNSAAPEIATGIPSFDLGQQNNIEVGQNIPAQENEPQQQITGFNDLSNKQLEVLSGSKNKSVSKPSEEVLKTRRALAKEDRADVRAAKKETLPIRKEIIDEANRARDSIRNKTHLLNIIDRGNIDDPTFAIFAEMLPYNLGKRMLSSDTVEYKGGLVDEFGDLKNIFKGATRVKEVEIYENKLADLYLNDQQKKAILKSRLNASKAPIIREEAAAEVEEKYPNISALQFNKKVDEIARPKLDKLFNSVWEEQKSILDQAESKKSITLDPQDPEDLQIMKQILNEARGDKPTARKIAAKKGYSW